MTLIQIGCGQSPIGGWVNYDNSPSIRLAKLPQSLIKMAGKLKLLDSQSIAYIRFCRANGIRYCDATRLIPWPDASVEAIYSSHMIEHLDRADAELFLPCWPGCVMRSPARVITFGSTTKPLCVRCWHAMVSVTPQPSLPGPPPCRNPVP